MRVLGIDCGTELTGFGVIESDGVVHRMIASGEMRTIIRQNEPDAAAVEEVFHAVNARSALKLAHVRGVALLVAADAGLGVGEYSPMEVKMSVVGYGRAEMAQVQLMVRSLLALETEAPEDA